MQQGPERLADGKAKRLVEGEMRDQSNKGIPRSVTERHCKGKVKSYLPHLLEQHVHQHIINSPPCEDPKKKNSLMWTLRRSLSTEMMPYHQLRAQNL